MKNPAIKLLPLAAWLLFLLVAGPEFLLRYWELALVLFAALILVPSGLKLLGFLPGRRYWIAVFGLGLGILLLPRPYVFVLALPYLVVAASMALRGLADLSAVRNFSLRSWVRIAALGYWATGALFLVSFLAGFQPLGFEPMVVALTAAHFHLAGFVLTVVVFCLLSDAPGRTNKIIAVASLAGMPLVATGITLTRLGFLPTFEWLSALGFALFALTIAWQHLALFFKDKYPRPARLLWLAAALCLLSGAVLAVLYALRFSYPISWVTIPNMKNWHGSLNTLGFAWMALGGWEMTRRTAGEKSFPRS